MNGLEILQLIAAIWRALGPVVTEMVAVALGGGDPLDVLARDRVEAILPQSVKLDLAMRAHQAAAAHAKR
jgi:hypothetical protein